MIVELKKGKTPREVTAQTLDYASWVKDLGVDRINEIASAYTKMEGSLEKAFEAKFETELPEVLNLSHRSLIVAESMDDSTERIVKYLSEMNVPINVATVQHFRGDDGRELLAQVYLVEPEAAEAKAYLRSKGLRLPNKSEMENEADKQRVKDLYDEICSQASSYLKTKVMRRFTLAFLTRINGRDLTLFVVDLDQSDGGKGLRFRLNATRLMNSYQLSKKEITGFLPKATEQMGPNEIRGLTAEEKKDWEGYKGYFQTKEEVDKFIAGLRGEAL